MLRCVVLSILLVAPAAASASLSLGQAQARYTFEEEPGEFKLLGCVSSCRGPTTSETHDPSGPR